MPRLFGNWVALHGYATLRASSPHFAWPAETTMLDRIVDSLPRDGTGSSDDTCRYD
jgi:hypothetical protein